MIDGLNRVIFCLARPRPEIFPISPSLTAPCAGGLPHLLDRMVRAASGIVATPGVATT
jgi:hypothetical protein